MFFLKRAWALAILLSSIAPPLLAQGRPAGLSDGRGSGSKPPVAANVAQPGGDEPVEVLRQRLADRLSSKEPLTPPKPAPAPAKARPEVRAEPKKPPLEVHWTYGGEGAPEHWGELKPEYRQCAVGQRQSPIDIREGIRVDLEPIQFDYRPGAFAVLNNGHTIQVSLAPGNILQVMGRRYELQQFHFHRPSEERINGRSFDMVAHLVHKDADGRLAVVAVLLDRGRDDRPQPLVQTIWNNLPLEKNDPLPGPGVLDPKLLLPEDRAYYTYMGSLTTPPCTEGVLWMVMRQPVAVSAEQISIFSRLYPMNARPIQSGAGRLIKESR